MLDTLVEIHVLGNIKLFGSAFHFFAPAGQRRDRDEGHQSESLPPPVPVARITHNHVDLDSRHAV
jgi:hypothetical protein